MILREWESLDHRLVNHGLDHKLVVLSILGALGTLSAFSALDALGVGALPFFFLVVALY